MRWQSPKNKLLLASVLLAVLLLLAPAHGISAATIARLVLGLGALAALAFWSHRRSGGAAKFQLPGRLTVAARTGLSPKCSVALVEADGRTFLVAFGDGFAEIQETPAAVRPVARQARKSKPRTRRVSPGASLKAVSR
jgi:hypothetical protein